MKIFDIWIGLDGVEKMGIGGWVAWWKHISHYFQHPSPVSHAPPFVTQCSTNPQIPSQTNPKNQQNTKFLNMNISGLAWYIIRIDCWSFVGLIVIHKIYTTVNQSKILNTFWLKIMNGTMGKFHKRDTKSCFLYQKEVSFISIYRRVSWDIWVKRSVDRGEVKTKKNNNCLSQWQLFPQRNFRSKMYTFAFLVKSHFRFSTMTKVMAKNIIFEIPEPHIAQQETKGLRVLVKVSEKKKKTANW